MIVSKFGIETVMSGIACAAILLFGLYAPVHAAAEPHVAGSFGSWTLRCADTIVSPSDCALTQSVADKSGALFVRSVISFDEKHALKLELFTNRVSSGDQTVSLMVDDQQLGVMGARSCNESGCEFESELGLRSLSRFLGGGFVDRSASA